MAEKGKDEKKKPRDLDSYSKMSRKDLEAIAEEARGMKHEDRFSHTMAAMVGYHESGVIDSEYNAMSAELTFGKKAGDMQKYYKTLHEEHATKKGDLGDVVATNWLRKFADTIMPAMGLGTEKSADMNYTHLKMYLKEASSEKDDVLARVRALIKKGKGHAAVAEIIDSITAVRKKKEAENFVELLLPADDYEHREYASKKIADEANAILKKQKKDYEVSPAKIAADHNNFVNACSHYAMNDMAGIINMYQVKKKEEKK